MDGNFVLYSTNINILYVIIFMMFFSVLIIDVFLFSEALARFSSDDVFPILFQHKLSMPSVVVFISITTFACFSVTSSAQLRIQFDCNAKKVVWENLRMDGRVVSVRDFQEVEAIVLPRQRLLFPSPPLLVLGGGTLLMEKRRLWRQDMAHIRELAEFAGFPLLEK